MWIAAFLGYLDSRFADERIRLEEGVRLSGSQILTETARERVYVVDLKQLHG